MATRQRNASIDLFKGLAILGGTLFGHASYVAGVLDLPLNSKISIIGQLELLTTIPLLFFLSGYTSTTGLLNLKNLFLRLFKLYIPYALAILLLIVILLFYREPLPSTIYKYFLLQIQEMTPHFKLVVWSMWFFPTFFIICLTTPVLILLSQNNRLSLFFIFLLIVTNCLFSFNEKMGQIRIYGSVNFHFFLFYLLFYFLGIYLKNQLITWKEFCCMILALIPISVYALNLAGFPSLHLLMFPPKIPFLLISLFSILSFLYLKNHENRLNALASNNYLLKFLSYNGKHVLTIYLYQGFICSALLESMIKLPATSNPYISLFLIFMVILLGTYPLVFLFIKINTLVLNLIFRQNFRFLKNKNTILDQIPTANH